MKINCFFKIVSVFVLGVFLMSGIPADIQSGYFSSGKKVSASVSTLAPAISAADTSIEQTEAKDDSIVVPSRKNRFGNSFGKINLRLLLISAALVVIVAVAGLLVSCGSADKPGPVTDNPPVQSSQEMAPEVAEAFETANGALAPWREETVSSFDSDPSDLNFVKVDSWWAMVNPDNGYLTHPHWTETGDMNVDDYSSSEAVSYQVLVAYDAYVLSGGDAQYAQLLKDAFNTYANTVTLADAGMQMPWLINATENSVDEQNSVSDADALVLLVLQKMNESGVFESEEFEGFTVEIQGQSYTLAEVLETIQSDYADRVLRNIAPEGSPAVYVVGISDGKASEEWVGENGFTKVNTSYNVWLNHNGDDRLDDAQRNLLRVILASQTWDLDGGHGVRGDASMGAIPGWMNIAASGNESTIETALKQEVVTIEGQEFSFWVLDHDEAPFEISRDDLYDIGLPTFQNFETHRSLVYLVDLLDRIYTKQVMFEQTGDSHYELTDSDMEAYKLASAILENYMNFQKIVLLTQGDGAMANDAYYITDNDAGPLGPVESASPGQAHAFGSDTKAGTIAAHLMAAMAVGDAELIEFYTAQLKDAVGFVDAAYDQAEGQFGDDVHPLHIYGKDGAEIQFTLGNPFAEGVFFINLLNAAPEHDFPDYATFMDWVTSGQGQASEYSSLLGAVAAAAGGKMSYSMIFLALGPVALVPFGAATTTSGGRGKKKVKARVVKGAVADIKAQYPDHHNVAAMTRDELELFVMKTPYFTVGKGSQLKERDRNNLINVTVNEIMGLVQDVVWDAIDHNEAARVDALMFDNVEDAVDNVPRSVLRYLFSPAKSGLFVMLSPDMIVNSAYNVEKSA